MGIEMEYLVGITQPYECGLLMKRMWVNDPDEWRDFVVVVYKFKNCWKTRAKVLHDAKANVH
jgi:hypothetical protein